MLKRASRLAAFAFALAVAVAGCKGSDGSQGPQGVQGTSGADVTAAAEPETCVVCHGTAAADHQSIYNQYQDGSAYAVTILDVQTVSSVTTMRFKVTKNGVPYTDPGLSQFNSPAVGRRTFASMSYDAPSGNFYNNTVSFGSPSFYTDGLDGQYVVTGAAKTLAPESSNSFVYMYIAGGTLLEPPEGNIRLYTDVVNVGQKFGSWTYTSAANVSGCEKCHGSPYRKHGYRAAVVPGLDDFVGCKGCHYDTRVGSDHDWQVMADDPVSYATTPISAAQRLKYAYTADVMSDTHMSHAMEFDYPQSMSNCVTCHDGKLGVVLANSKFQIGTCRTCHPITGPVSKYLDAKRAPPLTTLMTANGVTAHNSFINNLYANSGTPAPDCTVCHNGSAAPLFNQIHTGYDPSIYDSSGTRYSDMFSVTIDSAVLNATTLSIAFHGTKVGADPAVVASISPTISVGLYGYDTKDFIVDPHATVGGVRNLEWVFGASHPRFKNGTFNAGTGTWTVDVNLSDWATMINSTVKRLEVAVLPKLTDSTGTLQYALNAPSKTFDVAKNAFDPAFFSPIVDAAKCNKCHDALATTFHSPDRGGNVVVCRLCHNTRSGASHFEMQSRSIDSYVHAIHSFQQQDIKNLDFTDPVVGMRYALRMEAVYPMFTLLNCESCHNPNTYGVPAQNRSLPGVLSASAVVNTSRNIGVIPAAITGPGTRACGACHRAKQINGDVPVGAVINGAAVAADPDAASNLAAIDQHNAAMGYWLDNVTGALDAAIAKIMSFFQ